MAEASEKLITCAETGRIGGFARAKKLTPEQRRESARCAARARWAKKNGTPDPPTPPDPKGPQRDQQWAEAGILLNRATRKPSAGTTKALKAAA